NNLMEATAGGTLVIYNYYTVTTNTGAAITAEGGTIELEQAAITGGTLNSLAGGVVQTASGGVSTLTGVTINGTLNVVAGSTLDETGNVVDNGPIANSGLIVVNSSGT